MWLYIYIFIFIKINPNKIRTYIELFTERHTGLYNFPYLESTKTSTLVREQIFYEII